MQVANTMDVLETLGRTMGFSLAAGVNLYATVAILGLAAKYGWVALPEQFQAFDHDYVIIAAIVMYADRVLRGQDPVFRFALGRNPHRHPSHRRRGDRGDDAR